MQDNKPLHLGAVLGLCFAGDAFVSALIGGLALVSHASFITAFGWTFLILGALFVLFLIWLYIVQPNTWDKLSDKTQERLRNISVGVVIVFIFILFPAGIAGGSKWSGDGTVNLFPDDASSKNYRVTANMDVATQWFWKKTYQINSVQWPDGGSSSFSGCIIKDTSSACTDDEGRSWNVEFVDAPDAPESDSSN